MVLPMSDSPTPYRVLARKYRPQNFAELIGQEALVRTLTNAITTGRVAHAFMLTGVRGVGKTTTARIIARALNCTGTDGQGGPTPQPCGQCEACRSIAADRNPDVMEMDAASRTGVDDIREIIEGVRFKPIASRFKIYIIDEVHMLSKNAFNALLKTLEEPPEHTKFLFATTEIRKVPVTVLSRCQRFDLRRVEPEVLASHFTRIAEAEGASLPPDAAALLARAADGSVRDGLSLLDQAIAQSDGAVAAEPVRQMLGLADRAIVVDLFEAIQRGAMTDALAIHDRMHQAGAEPLAILQDLLELTHHLTRLHIGAGGEAPGGDPVREKSLAQGLSVPILTRTWQILLKGIAEVQSAPDPASALEMVLIRLGFVADLPTPGELVRKLTEGGGPSLPPGGGGNRVAMGGGAPQALAVSAPPREAPPWEEPATAPRLADPRSFEAVVALFGEKREPSLRAHLMNHVIPVSFESGRIEIRPKPEAPADLAAKVAGKLSEWTGKRWMVTIAGSGGGGTVRDAIDAKTAQTRRSIEDDPLVREILAAFPGATIETVTRLSDTPPELLVEQLEPGEEDGDSPT